MKQKLDKKILFTGIWESIITNGSLPDSREGSTGCIINNNVYIFGGFARNLFNDLRVLDANFRWKILDNTISDNPSPRFYNTMVAYKNRYLIIFVGGGPFSDLYSMRFCLDDLHIFDT
jgi:N-acetylneuraminic acid mutarotase